MHPPGAHRGAGATPGIPDAGPGRRPRRPRLHGCQGGRAAAGLRAFPRRPPGRAQRPLPWRPQAVRAPGPAHGHDRAGRGALVDPGGLPPGPADGTHAHGTGVRPSHAGARAVGRVPQARRHGRGPGHPADRLRALRGAGRSRRRAVRELGVRRRTGRAPVVGPRRSRGHAGGGVAAHRRRRAGRRTRRTGGARHLRAASASEPPAGRRRPGHGVPGGARRPRTERSARLQGVPPGCAARSGGVAEHGRVLPGPRPRQSGRTRLPGLPAGMAADGGAATGGAERRPDAAGLRGLRPAESGPARPATQPRPPAESGRVPPPDRAGGRRRAASAAAEGPGWDRGHAPPARHHGGGLVPEEHPVPGGRVAQLPAHRLRLDAAAGP